MASALIRLDGRRSGAGTTRSKLEGRDCRRQDQGAAESDPAPTVRKKAGWFVPDGPIWRRTLPREARNRRRN